MKQIRQQVFETNSSSSHSISIIELNDSDLMDNSLIPDKQGIINLYGGEFGWEIEDYNDAQTKASYMAVYSALYCSDTRDELIQTLKDVITKQTGAKEVNFKFTESDSYIDHQSCEPGAYDFVFENPEEMRNFIFNPKSILHTDNDNH